MNPLDDEKDLDEFDIWFADERTNKKGIEIENDTDECVEDDFSEDSF